MVNGDAGKGSKPRPVDRKRWDHNHVMAFGVDCKNCGGSGKVWQIPEVNLQDTPASLEDCPFCDGLGKVDRYARQ